MFKQRIDNQEAAIAVSTIEELAQADPANGTRGVQITIKHIHEYQGSGLMEAFLALLTALLFIFGSVFLTIAASNFYQGVQSNRPTQRF